MRIGPDIDDDEGGLPRLEIGEKIVPECHLRNLTPFGADKIGKRP